MRWLPVLLLVATPLTGCLGGGDDEAAEEQPEAPPVDESAEPGSVSYAATNNSTMDDNMTIGDVHFHDYWGTATEVVLFDGSVQTTDCGGEFGFFGPVFLALIRREAAVGCAEVDFDSGIVVPEGTAALRIEADATAALKQGGYQVVIVTNADARHEGDISTEPAHTWSMALNATDWDLPHQEDTGYSIIFYARGQVAVLDGQISVRVVAEKLPGFVPVLAQAHLAHWDMGDMHNFVQPGAVRVLDTTVQEDFPSWADYFANGFQGRPERVPLQDIILPGTRQVTLAVMWDSVSNCPAGHTCRPTGAIVAGDSFGFRRGELVDAGENFEIYLYNVPDDVGQDSTYATESVYGVEPGMDVCTIVGDDGRMCGMGRLAARTSASVRFEVEAWRDFADVRALKDRLGLGAGSDTHAELLT